MQSTCAMQSARAAAWMLHAFCCRGYAPVLHVLRQAALSVGTPLSAAEAVVAAAGLRLCPLAGHTQVLVDAKYFVKDYGGALAQPPPKQFLRLLCQVGVFV